MTTNEKDPRNSKLQPLESPSEPAAPADDDRTLAAILSSISSGPEFRRKVAPSSGGASSAEYQIQHSIKPGYPTDPPPRAKVIVASDPPVMPPPPAILTLRVPRSEGPQVSSHGQSGRRVVMVLVVAIALVFSAVVVLRLLGSPAGSVGVDAGLGPR